MRTAEIIVICPARSSKGARNEEKCMMTIARDSVNLLKSRQDIVEYETKTEIAGQMMCR